ncbi:MAG TPA: hypothetical protein VLB27_04485, partial [candidate division Zixibacteria bacterium]|nr:hypothetical protein [candidate division Zixibacteria bacterium]
MTGLRDKFTILAATLCGVVMVVQYFFDQALLNKSYSTLLNWMQIIFACALLVGILAVLKNHLMRVVRDRHARFYSGVLIVAAAVMAIAGFAGGIDRDSAFQWLFNNIQAPMQATVFSLLAFYVTSAAYRGFRARSTESVVLILAGFIVLLGRVPIGEWLIPSLPDSARWIVGVPALAAKRAI